jgi:hypothetical protein
LGALLSRIYIACLADVTNLSGDTVSVPEGATDAALTPYHVARSKLYVRERFGKIGLSQINSSQIEANIEHTRFPVPQDEEHAPTGDLPGLFRAADLIGQLADINYLRKTAALFAEFRETGMSERLRYNSPADLRALSAIFLAGGTSLHRRCVALPSSYPRGKTVDREPLCKCVLDRA